MAVERDLLHQWTLAVRGEIDEISAHLVQGLAEDWGEYQRLTGRVSGLTRALELLADEMRLADEYCEGGDQQSDSDGNAWRH